ncbi:unnamed protein product [Heligmosomoides polygyrus]|uniref:Uncharacterized protein n=1 Tax=Heligmosomoides polygyrus TaxID=6339 RepID=A0A183GHR8_HELPZ|nr:unnamed protein product [Heligmosomoides polygyrus]
MFGNDFTSNEMREATFTEWQCVNLKDWVAFANLAIIKKAECLAAIQELSLFTDLCGLDLAVRQPEECSGDDPKGVSHSPIQR